MGGGGWGDKASPKRLSLPNTAWGSPSPEAAGYAGLAAQDDEEQQQQLAANRHSLVEKLGELVAGAHALAEGLGTKAWVLTALITWVPCNPARLWQAPCSN